jgi:branched-chain amino acid transport system ATP-binding protein
MSDAILSIENLSKSFEGNQVFNNISFSVEPGELSAIIGPNGAGKTTLFNLITGALVPDEGKIIFEGRNIVGMEPFDIVRLGMARAFQRTNIFPRMTVLENVVVTIITRLKANLSFVKPWTSSSQIRLRAFEILESVGLDIGVALALEPKLLLLDEPTAGMSPEERWETVELVKELWNRMKITMVYIEHDMDIVFGISQKVRVLCYKTLLAEGPPHEISANQQVIEAYLGEEV